MKIGCCLPGDFRRPGDTGEYTPVRSLQEGYDYMLQAGFDYIEYHVGGIAALTQEEFDRAEQLHRRGLLTIESFNCLLPGGIRLIGAQANRDEAIAYLERTMPRLAALGGEIAVFGSGGARRIPEGVPEAEAQAQLEEFLIRAEAVARPLGMTLVVEPLNRKESNSILSVARGAAIVRKLDLPALKLLADVYHMYQEKEPAGILGDQGDILRHVHAAEPETRGAPVDCPYLNQVSRELHRIGYTGRVTIEGWLPDPVKDSVEAQPVMRRLFGPEV